MQRKLLGKLLQSHQRFLICRNGEELYRKRIKKKSESYLSILTALFINYVRADANNCNYNDLFLVNVFPSEGEACGLIYYQLPIPISTKCSL